MDREEPVIELLQVSGDRVNPRLMERMQRACQIMASRSWERGDAWKNTGMVGAFVEMYNCFQRVRRLVWDRPPEEFLKGNHPPADGEWVSKVEDVLEDLRNFSILMELAMAKGIYHGSYSVGKKPKVKKRR